MSHVLTKTTDTLYLMNGTNIGSTGTYTNRLLSYNGTYLTSSDGGYSNLGHGNLGYTKFTGNFQQGKTVVFCGMGNQDIGNDNRCGSILVY